MGELATGSYPDLRSARWRQAPRASMPFLIAILVRTKERAVNASFQYMDDAQTAQSDCSIPQSYVLHARSCGEIYLRIDI